ncbi:MAG: hypothetical protein PUJ57_04060 [Peptoniphilaceae bacterium]|nr:hypothetical protein [Peptoniphilaceae bacterium]
MRLEKVIRNSKFLLVQRAAQMVAQFAVRTAFLWTIGVSYLGLSAVFGDIFMMLSLVELGIGTAFTYFLYEPIAQEDHQHIRDLLELYRRAYLAVAGIVAVIGIALFPFLPQLVQSDVALSELQSVYLLLLANTVAGYFFSYRQTVFTAYQAQYVNAAWYSIFYLLTAAGQIVVLFLTKNYLAFLAVDVLFQLLRNLLLARLVTRAYPAVFEKTPRPLPADEKRFVFQRVAALFFHRLGSVAMNGTDSLVMSFFARLSFVGLYANYMLVYKGVLTIAAQLFAVLTPSVGNLSVTENRQKSRAVFERLFFANAWIALYVGLGLALLLNPFLSFWLSEAYVLPLAYPLLIGLMFFTTMIRQSAVTFNQAGGYFWQTRYKPLVEAALDLGFSLLFAHLLGPIGIVLGNIASLVLVSVWYDGFILYRDWFHAPFADYLRRTALAFLAFFALGGLTFAMLSAASRWGLGFIGQAVLLTLFVNGTLFVALRKTDAFQYYWGILQKRIKKRA